MKINRKNKGFSLTEMLIATGIMAIGLVMVATIFPVGVKLTSLSTERTIGAVAADEAFAKIQLYGLRPFIKARNINWPVGGDPYGECVDFQYIVKEQDFNGDGTIDALGTGWDEFRYPSTLVSPGQQRNYHWSAICRKVEGGAKEVQVTVFVTRKVASASQYRAWDPSTGVATSNWPKPVPVNVSFLKSKELQIVAGPDTLTAADSQQFFDDGYTIVDNYSGRIYRVLEVDRINNKLILQQPWVDNGLATETIWVVPPAVGSDRYPCVGVYQKIIRFDDIN